MKNQLPHEIWAGDPLNVNTPLHEPAVETRISGDMLHIDFRFDIPSRIDIDTMFGAYRRLASGELRCGTVLLDLPIIDNSREVKTGSGCGLWMAGFPADILISSGFFLAGRSSGG